MVTLGQPFLRSFVVGLDLTNPASPEILTVQSSNAPAGTLIQNGDPVNSDGNDGLSIWVIIAICVVGLILIALIIFFVWKCIKKRKE